MSCAGCAARVEKALNGVDGAAATVNLATERATVLVEQGGTAPADLVRAVEGAGYEARLGAVEAPAPAAPVARLAVAAGLTVPLALLAMVDPLQFGGWEWLALALAAPVVLWAGAPFHRGALRSARHGGATMDTLVSLGTLAAFGWSVVALLALDGADTYFEAAAVITTLVLFGRTLEARARRRSSDAVRALLELGAKEARVLRDGREVAVSPEDVRV